MKTRDKTATAFSTSQFTPFYSRAQVNWNKLDGKSESGSGSRESFLSPFWLQSVPFPSVCLMPCMQDLVFSLRQELTIAVVKRRILYLYTSVILLSTPYRSNILLVHLDLYTMRLAVWSGPLRLRVVVVMLNCTDTDLLLLSSALL